MEKPQDELTRLSNKLYNAVIREREMGHTLKLVQNAQAQTPTSQPAPAKPTTQPVQPKPPAQPAPQKPPTQQQPVRHFSSQSTAIFHWQTGQYSCLQCARVTLGVRIVDETLQQGKALSDRNWLSRVDNASTRCDICSRKIG
jgi:hypothetical protein